MPDTQLGEQRVDRSHLHAVSSAMVAQSGGFDVIATIRDQKRQGGEPFDDLLRSGWAGKTLQQFLQDHAGGDHRLPRLDQPGQLVDVRVREEPVSPKR